MNEYTALKEASMRHKENNDCTVKAYAIVTGCSYEDAHWEMMKVGRRNRKGLLSDYPDYNNKMIEALRRKGFTVERVKCNSKTVRTLGRNIKSNGRFLVFVRGHVLAIKDKQVMDWTNGRCHRIKSVWRVK